MNYLKFGIQLLKWLPVISTLAIIISFILILNGISVISLLSHPLSCAMLPCVLIFVFSKIFRFCRWHRILIVNLFVVALISWINANFYRLPNLEFIRTILLITSLSGVISTILYLNHGCFKKALTKVD